MNMSLFFEPWFDQIVQAPLENEPTYVMSSDFVDVRVKGVY